MSPDGKYFISPLRINGSAIESIYSVLKFASGGNLSALSYGPALGKLINRKDMIQNKYSEKGYRDVVLNISGLVGANVPGSITNMSVDSQKLSSSLCIFSFPGNIAQSTVGDRQGSNACTIIAVKFGNYCNQQKLDVSLLWNQLPNVWVDSFVNAICDGNSLYDELYGDPAVYLDVEDVVNEVGQDFHVQSANQLIGFTSANEYSDLVGHISGAMHSSTTDLYGVLIGCQKSVGFLVKTNGLCAIIDSHQHVTTNSGGMIIMADHPKKAILEYSKSLASQGYNLNQGTLTWVQYSMPN